MSAAAAAAVAAGLVIGGCGSDPQETSAQRSANVVAQCRDNGGVAAFDDDSVICADQTFSDVRGERAVRACRERDGVAAFDDDIVICGDQSVHAVEGG
jgi:hypothetical protein